MKINKPYPQLLSVGTRLWCRLRWGMQILCLKPGYIAPTYVLPNCPRMNFRRVGLRRLHERAEIRKYFTKSKTRFLQMLEHICSMTILYSGMEKFGQKKCFPCITFFGVLFIFMQGATLFPCSLFSNPLCWEVHFTSSVRHKRKKHYIYTWFRYFKPVNWFCKIKLYVLKLCGKLLCNKAPFVMKSYFEAVLKVISKLYNLL